MGNGEMSYRDDLSAALAAKASAEARAERAENAIRRIQKIREATRAPSFVKANRRSVFAELVLFAGMVVVGILAGSCNGWFVAGCAVPVIIATFVLVLET